LDGVGRYAEVDASEIVGTVAVVQDSEFEGAADQGGQDLVCMFA